MNEVLGLIHPRAELVSICERVELEIKGPAHKIHWWGRRKSTVEAFLLNQREMEGKKKKRVPCSKQLQNPTGQTP